MSRRQPFLNIRTEGALLPSDLLSRLLEGENLPGLKPDDYHLGAGEKLNEAISRSWTRLLSIWASFRKSQAVLPATDLGTTLTREKWLLPLFQELGYGRLIGSSPFEIDGKSYPISHLWHGQNYQVPVHLVSFRADMDRRSEQKIHGASKASPHGLLQEFLNRSESHLWAFVSNGLKLRILRDNASLTRQAQVEFDLEGIFESEAYADFRLLWMVCHQSRIEGTTKDCPETCWLEKWSKQAQTEGRRALDHLRDGVEKSLAVFGTGFISHPANKALRDRLQGGELRKDDFYRQLLRLAYRLIFLFVAEDRDLLHPPGTSELSRSRYARFYSGQRLRKMAERSRGGRHTDLWVGLKLVFQMLERDEGCPTLGLPALGGFLFGVDALPDLATSELANEHLLLAIRHLGVVKDRSGLRLVDYRNLGSEELGGIYESLLELDPIMELDAGVFTLETTGGSERKTTGSYYTPESLIQCLLDTTLVPVIEEASANPIPEKALLNLKICDPACGSGHFLLAAAHRIARRLAGFRMGEEAPSSESIRTALRDVIGHCLYGVDINPMAVELCKVSLWLEALEPGKPLSFLDHHVRNGNSLLGATPELVAGGLPDEVFTPIEGDDKKACIILKKRNKVERQGFGPLFAQQDAEIQSRLQSAAAALDELPDDRLEAIHAKERAFRSHELTEEFRQKIALADTWCAAFIIQKTQTQNDPNPVGITQSHLNDLANGQMLHHGLVSEIRRIATQYQFFHWHLAFPEVYARGGFDVVIGNPPWRMTEEDSRVEDVNEIVVEGIGKLEYGDARTKRERAFYSRSRRFPLSANNRLQLARIFAELFGTLYNKNGVAGMIVPSTLTVNAFDRPLWISWIKSKALHSVWDFVNSSLLFPDVYWRQKFVLISIYGKKSNEFSARCWMTDPLQINTERDQIAELSESDLFKYSGQELALPHFRSRIDLNILTTAIFKFGRLFDSKEWVAEYVLLGATNDRDFIRERRRSYEIVDEANDCSNQKDWLPVYEGKMVGAFDHRMARVVWRSGNAKRKAQEQALTDVDKADPTIFATPLWEVPRSLMVAKDNSFAQRGWDIALCDVTSALNERTAIAAIVPLCFATHNLPLVRVCGGDTRASLMFLATLSSFALDFFARLRVATNHLTEGIFFSLPIPSPKQIKSKSLICFADEWGIAKRVLELSYTAWDLQSLAEGYGYSGPPFQWDEDRRFKIRCELNAAFFRIYLPCDSNGDWQWEDEATAKDTEPLKNNFKTPRDAVSYIMDTFPILRRRDEEKFEGDYRTKSVIVEIYDAMQLAFRTGQPYQTRLDPPPADQRCCHPVKSLSQERG